MKTQELCRRLDVEPRHVKYLLEEGMIPTGVDPAPATGHHRELTVGQAFWLGVVLKLKQIGVKAPLARDIVNYAKRYLRGITRNASWDFQFSPFDGDLEAAFQWFVEIGDNKYIRILTDGNPSHDGIYSFPWFRINGKTEVPNAHPAVCIQVDLTHIAEMLR